MKMTQSEYKELVANLEYLADKAEACYAQEVAAALLQLKASYLKYVI